MTDTPDDRPLRILLAEDNLVARKLVVRLLEKYGHTVTAVNDGAAALAAWQAGPDAFDAAVLDVEMPELDGPDVAQAIRDAGATLPIVALTGHADDPTESARCTTAGMDRVVGKPVDAAALLATIRELLAR